MSGSKNSINGSVTGVGIVTGGEVTQIFNNKHKTPPQLTSKLGKSTIIGRKKVTSHYSLFLSLFGYCLKLECLFYGVSIFESTSF